MRTLSPIARRVWRLSSAAFWLESYGGPVVAQLSAASHGFLDAPPSDFADHSFLRTRGALHVTRGALPDLPASVETRLVERAELEDLVPGIQPDWHRAVWEPGCADIDVAALHAAYLRQFKRQGGQIRTDARLVEGRFDDEWSLRFESGDTVSAGIVVDAAGAWADPVAASCGVARIGILPKRRTMVQLRVGRSGLRDLAQVIDQRRHPLRLPRRHLRQNRMTEFSAGPAIASSATGAQDSTPTCM